MPPCQGRSNPTHLYRTTLFRDALCFNVCRNWKSSRKHRRLEEQTKGGGERKRRSWQVWLCQEQKKKVVNARLVAHRFPVFTRLPVVANTLLPAQHVNAKRGRCLEQTPSC